jgi:biofilm PGA synthesis lipoprotein PgaB
MRILYVVRALGLFGAAVLVALPGAASPATPPGRPAASPAYILYRDAAVVLTYHDVSTVVPRGTDTVSPAEFAAEMDRLAADGFQFISVPRLERFVSHGAPVPPNAVCVVFDNGYQGIYRYALPVLERRRIPAAVFLIVRNVSSLRTDLTWSEVRIMARSGFVHFYTETYDLHHGIAIAPGRSVAATVGRALLPDGQQESVAAYRHRVLGDLVRARTTVERETGQHVDAMVYPYGQYTPELISLARAAGYRYLFTTLGWPVTPQSDPSRVTRLDIGVWNQTPDGVVGAVRAVIAQARRSSYTPPASYIRVWR